MPEEKRVIPYKAGKGNRPKIEEVIECCLSGQLQAPALDFVRFMRENGMPLRIKSSSTRSQRADYMKEPICNIFVYDENDWDKVDKHSEGDPQYYTISPFLIMFDMYEHRIAEERLDSIQWDSFRPCNVCNKDCWSKGVDRTALNKEFTHICWFMRPLVKNPDEEQLDGMKRLLLLEKQARDEFGQRPLAPQFRS